MGSSSVTGRSGTVRLMRRAKPLRLARSPGPCRGETLLCIDPVSRGDAPSRADRGVDPLLPAAGAPAVPELAAAAAADPLSLRTMGTGTASPCAAAHGSSREGSGSGRAIVASPLRPAASASGVFPAKTPAAAESAKERALPGVVEALCGDVRLPVDVAGEGERRGEAGDGGSSWNAGPVAEKGNACLTGARLADMGGPGRITPLLLPPPGALMEANGALRLSP